jgi:hypothetical protein
MKFFGLAIEDLVPARRSGAMQYYFFTDENLEIIGTADYLDHFVLADMTLKRQKVNHDIPMAF